MSARFRSQKGKPKRCGNFYPLLLKTAALSSNRNGRDDLGYTMADLKGRLERLFSDGMTWDRFFAGDIVTDHRVPLSAFDLTNEDEFRVAWSIANLQPLWAADNRLKGADVTLDDIEAVGSWFENGEATVS